MECFSDKSNCYSLIVSGKELNITKKEMKKISGLSIMMGKLKLLGIRTYWGSITKVSLIAGLINLDRYFKRLSNFHVVNQCNPVPENNDQFWKVKPAIEAITALISKWYRLQAECHRCNIWKWTISVRLKNYYLWQSEMANYFEFS